MFGDICHGSIAGLIYTACSLRHAHGDELLRGLSCDKSRVEAMVLIRSLVILCSGKVL